MSNRVKFSRILQFFREADADEVRAIMPLVVEACGKRKIVIMVPGLKVPRRRLNAGVTEPVTEPVADDGSALTFRAGY